MTTLSFEGGEHVGRAGDAVTVATSEESASATAGDAPRSVTEEIDALAAANQVRRAPDVEARLIELRAAAFEHLGQRIPTRQPHPGTGVVAPASTSREVTREALTVDVLRVGIRQHGSLIVRGLIPQTAVDRLVADIDRALDAARAHRTGSQLAATAPWYVPFVAPQGQSLDFDRRTVEEHDGVLAADSPRTMYDLIEAYEQAGLRDLIAQYFGARPVLTVKKTTLRRVGAGTGTQWWHQDGAFLGRVGALNVWLSLSHCGDDAPSLDLVGRRIDEILPTGVEGAAFNWSLGRSVVDRYAAGEIVRPRFGPGDALLFDELLVHQTGSSPDMQSIRYAIESWFFSPWAVPADRIPLLF
jgi:hypothetical protein